MKATLLFLIYSSALFAEIKITVEGMTCKSCTEKIKYILSENTKIDKISAELEKKLIIVEIDDEDKLPDETIIKLITDEGYKVSKIERK